jgi:hypothetical protein
MSEDFLFFGGNTVQKTIIMQYCLYLCHCNCCSCANFACTSFMVSLAHIHSWECETKHCCTDRDFQACLLLNGYSSVSSLHEY